MRHTRGERIFQVFDVLLLAVFMLAAIYPFLYVAFASISHPARIVAHRGILLYPLGFSTAAYKMVFENPNIMSGYKNTLIILFAGTSLNLLLTSFGAYALSRKQVGASRQDIAARAPEWPLRCRQFRPVP